MAEHSHSEHRSTPFERRCDVAVVGGSAAGLAAALQLGRQRRSVIVVDSGEPRNAPAAHMHSFLGREGQPPSELIAAGREEVRSYGGEILSGRVAAVTRDDGGFRVALDDDRVIVARRVVAATGLVDVLPDIEGLAERWGRDVIHCPFCHGFEVRDQRIVQIVTHPMGLHPAPLWRQLSGQLTIVVHDEVDADAAELESLRTAGVEVLGGRVRRVVTTDDRVSAVELNDGTVLDADVVAVGTRFRPWAEPFEPLGIELAAHPSGAGDVVETDAMGATSVPGLFAVGNVSDPSQQVMAAAADGSRVGGMISFSLAHEDLADRARPLADEADWDHRYGGEQIWSGNPNGTLVAEVADLAPGRALDVGAGEGGDAVWLAEQGWAVTASDISQRVLDRIAGASAARNLDVACVHSDANSLDPFEPVAFDVVIAFYVSISRTPDDRAIDNVLAAVAPGGTLLVVGHDLAPMRAKAGSAAFDPDAYVGVDHFAATLAARSDWTIEAHELRARPAGAASGSHHAEDVVLRARRVASA